eukprot:TRINITY_DN1426_c0_g1_i3.p1 TRINITY_DN1426_c0_g1~~TRINITY_DN1426_c0_g1_i3.p1  ORF type:complete len:740 (+),score=168.90 TRINITY_DN1426_c0_g1_i3:149-2221(+)
MFQGKAYNIGLWDTAGQEDYDRLRPLSYPQTDVFLLCYSSVSKASLENVKSKWIPEIKHHCPNVPIVLCATKIDLKNNEAMQRGLNTRDEGIQTAKEIGARAFVENSALTQDGIRETFDKCLESAVTLKSSLPTKSKGYKQPRLPPIMPPAGKAPWIEIKTATISEDFGGLLDRKSKDMSALSDIVFITRDKKELLCHKVVLSSVSDYFRRMLNSLEQEKNEQTHLKERQEQALQPSVPEAQREVVEQPKMEDNPEDPSNADQEELNPAFCCPICQELYSAPILQCSNGHSFCEGCIVPWVEKKKSCASCRSEIQVGGLVRNRALEEIVQVMASANKLKIPRQAASAAKPAEITVSKKLPEHGKYKGPAPLFIRVAQMDGFSRWTQRPSAKSANSLVDVVFIDEEVSPDSFNELISFLYTGVLNKKKKCPLDEITKAGKTFGCEEICTVCYNIMEDNEFLNPSIGTWLNDKNADSMREKYFLKEALSDLVIKVQSQGVSEEFPVHQAIVRSRCKVINQALSRQQDSDLPANHTITGVNEKIAHTFIEYLYTEHAPLDDLADDELFSLMEQSNKFAIERLKNLCELKVSKVIERANTTSIKDSRIDVIGILLRAQDCDASQLASFCLHFISSNYGPMKSRNEFSRLRGANLAHVERNRWPPLSYLQEMEEYEKEMKTSSSSSDQKANCLIM